MLFHPQPPLLAQGSSAPGVSLRDASGTLHTVVGSAASRPALLEFLSSSCVTCRSSAGSLCSAAAMSGVTVAAVDAGDESAQTVRAFAAQSFAAPCHVPVLLDPGLTVTRAYEVGVVPTVYVVDIHGNIAYGGYGAAGVGEAVQALRTLAHG